ncbi:hypothetical protein C1X65_23740 [Pseudomonas sp. FW305-70]|nr:hypothetical protein C1X65_23740 [Pseudomonas sp. FW305-70]
MRFTVKTKPGFLSPVPAPSRASPLPQVQRNPCGSGLAREGVDAVLTTSPLPAPPTTPETASAAGSDTAYNSPAGTKRN